MWLPLKLLRLSAQGMVELPDRPGTLELSRRVFSLLNTFETIRTGPRPQKHETEPNTTFARGREG